MKRVLVILTMALIMAALMALNVGGGTAFAKIGTTSSTGPCTNAGGNAPGGQQPTCVGGGLTQTTTAFATNPSGNRPPGQQP